MKVKKIYKALLESIPKEIDGRKISYSDRELISILQIKDIIYLLGNKKNDRKWVKKQLMNKGMFLKTTRCPQ